MQRPRRVSQKEQREYGILNTKKGKYFEEEAVISHSKCFYKNVFICKWVAVVLLLFYKAMRVHKNGSSLHYVPKCSHFKYNFEVSRVEINYSVNH